MATDISEEEMQKIFKRFDANGDGKISPAEIGEALRSVGNTSTSPDDIQRRMAEVDTNGDGYIDYNELVAFCKANPNLTRDVTKLLF